MARIQGSAPEAKKRAKKFSRRFAESAVARVACRRDHRHDRCHHRPDAPLVRGRVAHTSRSACVSPDFASLRFGYKLPELRKKVFYSLLHEGRLVLFAGPPNRSRSEPAISRRVRQPQVRLRVSGKSRRLYDSVRRAISWCFEKR